MFVHLLVFLDIISLSGDADLSKLVVLDAFEKEKYPMRWLFNIFLFIYICVLNFSKKESRKFTLKSKYTIIHIHG